MDKYDEAIAYLTEHPDAIQPAWGYPEIKPGGCLFSRATKDKSNRVTGDSFAFCGSCLTQIRRDSFFVAETPELTEEIRADERIPLLSNKITIEHLPIFAEWQRRLDKELGRS